MSVGSKIKFFRELRGLTQKELGKKIGITDYSGVRIAQYESDSRTPKSAYMLAIAKTLKITPEALEADVDDLNKVAQFLFELERKYGLTIKQTDDDSFVLYIDKFRKDTKKLNKIFSDWSKEYEVLSNHTIRQKDYEEWQYKYKINK